MGVSRQTLGNIISSARTKISDCVVNGKMLRIEGGTVMVQGQRNFTCSDCGHGWNVAHGTGRPRACPSCGSTNLHRAAEDRGPRRGSTAGGPGCHAHGHGLGGHGQGRGFGNRGGAPQISDGPAKPEEKLQ
jgi:predicted RNA-binding Zn-ribbon protein involved in translation (DUF1610 family)